LFCISRPPLISRGLHLYLEASTYISRPPLISRGRHLYLEASTYISRPPLICRGLHLYLEASTYISRPPLIYRGLHLYVAASTYISRPPLIYCTRHLMYNPPQTILLQPLYLAAATYYIAAARYVVVTGNFHERTHMHCSLINTSTFHHFYIRTPLFIIPYQLVYLIRIAVTIYIRIILLLPCKYVYV
jgi:hypothetical protein